MKITAYIKEKPIKFALYCVLCVILAFLFIVLGTLLVEKFIKKSKVPMFAGYAMMRIVSPSMSGTLEVGDYIIIHRTNNYERNDIVTFVVGSDVITHRIVHYADPETGEPTSEYTGTFITGGDFNDKLDDDPVMNIGTITEAQIVGERVLTIPKLGLVFDWFLKENGFVYVIVMIAIIGAIVYFWHDADKENGGKAEASEGASDGDGQADDAAPENDSESAPTTPENPPVTSDTAPMPEDSTSESDGADK